MEKANHYFNELVRAGVFWALFLGTPYCAGLVAKDNNVPESSLTLVLLVSFAFGTWLAVVVNDSLKNKPLRLFGPRLSDRNRQDCEEMERFVEEHKNFLNNDGYDELTREHFLQCWFLVQEKKYSPKKAKEVLHLWYSQKYGGKEQVPWELNWDTGLRALFVSQFNSLEELENNLR